MSKIEIVTGIGKESKKEWKAIKVVVGDWQTLVFPKTKFEMDYIEKTIEDEKNDFTKTFLDE